MSEDNCIFIVEDDPNIRFGLEEIFRGEKFTVASCENGSDAIDQIGEHLPDLIILDVMLPGKTATKFAKSCAMEVAGSRS